MQEYCSLNNDEIKKDFGRGFSKQLEFYKKNNYEKPDISDNEVYEDISNAIDYKDTSNMNKWKNGKEYPTVENLFKLAQFFNCSIDELFDRANPYEQLNHQMREKGFSEEAIKIIELWLRKNPKTRKALFGDDIQVNDWGTFDFLNDLICNKEINKLIGYYYEISEEFFNLSNDDIEKLNTKIPELKQSYIYRDNEKVLKSLLLELPKEMKHKVQKIKDDIDLFLEFQTAIYILKIYENATKRKI